jgi:hemerythrin-like domain-containing protein
MSKAIADLMNDHEAILTAIQILDRIVATSPKNSSQEKKDIHDFIGFLKEFADQCHHGKEEGLLFPAMIKAGFPEHGGPISVMLAEHAQCRWLIRDMEEAIAKDIDLVKLIGAARGYASLLKNHIEKENKILFPMAENALTGTQLEELHKGFEQHEEKVIGQGRHEELHAILKSLQEKYPG